MSYWDLLLVNDVRKAITTLYVRKCCVCCVYCNVAPDCDAPHTHFSQEVWACWLHAYHAPDGNGCIICHPIAKYLFDSKELSEVKWFDINYQWWRCSKTDRQGYHLFSDIHRRNHDASDKFVLAATRSIDDAEIRQFLDGNQIPLTKI